MPTKQKASRAATSSRAPRADQELATPASAAETAEYVAEMCAELRMLAKSSANYIASMSCELSTLATSARLERLASLLESVRREAETTA
jgi:hypothetical protein